MQRAAKSGIGQAVAQSSQSSSQIDKSGFLPKCTVAIPTRDRPALLDRCLEAVSQLDYPSFDVLVVENVPTNDLSREAAARWKARYIVEPVSGVSRARNRALRECTSEIVAFLDDDSLPRPDWLSGIVNAFQDPAVMAVTGLTQYYDRALELKDPSFLTGNIVSQNVSQLTIDRTLPSWFNLVNFGDIGGAANMAFRRQVVEVWPGFDERLGLGAFLEGYADRNVLFTLIKRGYGVTYTPHAVVYHPSVESAPNLPFRHIQRHTALAGYLALLFAEEGEHRRDVLDFIVDRFRRMSGRGRPRNISIRSELRACVAGVLRYVRSRRHSTPGSS